LLQAREIQRAFAPETGMDDHKDKVKTDFIICGHGEQDKNASGGETSPPDGDFNRYQAGLK
jgi:hypothetical protein